MSAQDKRTHAELYQEVLGADWGISNTMYTSYGATVTFRKGPFTFDFPSLETKDVHGKDEDDAMRKFLAQLKEQ